LCCIVSVHHLNVTLNIHSIRSDIYNMEQIVKVFYNDNEEVRKVKCNFLDGFYELEKRLKDAFNLDRSSKYRIFWLDHEGDLIRVSGDADIQVMLTEMHSRQQSATSNWKLFIKTASQNAPETTKTEHVHIYCDGCNTKPIVGIRFKCLECSDFDLCETCFKRNIHPQHKMMVMRSSEHSPFANRFGGCPRRCQKTNIGCRSEENKPAVPNKQPEYQPNTVEMIETSSNKEKPLEVPPQSPRQVEPVSNPFTQESSQPTGITSQSSQPPAQSTTPSSNTGQNVGQGWPHYSSPANIYPSAWSGLYPMQPATPQPFMPSRFPQTVAAPITNPNDRDVPQHIRNARNHMLTMGYNDENGWLTQLLLTHKGDISKCLDDIQTQSHALSRK
jgi:hypothetical protein